MPDLSKCSSCGAPIRWVTMAKSGSAMPVDAKPEPRVVLSSVYGQSETGTVQDTYVSHFSTCPDAAKHRRKP